MTLRVGQVPASYDPVLSVPEGNMIPAAKENRLLYSALQARQAKFALLKFEAVLIVLTAILAECRYKNATTEVS